MTVTTQGLRLRSGPATLRSALELEDRVGSWVEAMARDSGGGHWTDPARHPDGALWKAPVPTSRGRAPAEPRVRPPRRKEGKEPREPRPPPAPKLAFKPLSELAPGEPAAPSPAPEEPPAPTSAPEPAEAPQGTSTPEPER